MIAWKVLSICQRGSGIDGLIGSQNNGKIIRPFINLKNQKFLNMLKKINLNGEKMHQTNLISI